MTDKELLQQALDALEMSHELQDIGWVDFEAYKLTCDADILSKLNITIDAIKARLAQPENEFNPDWDRIGPLEEALREHMAEIQRLRALLAQPEPQQYVDFFNVRTSLGVETIFSAPYTKPPKKEWVGLTKDEVNEWELPDKPTVFEFAQFVEAKLKEKNSD